jgi:hypothetical protein
MAEIKNKKSEKQEPRYRKEYDPPAAVAEWGWRYHHLGIPTNVPQPNEVYLEHLKIYVSGYETSPYGIEWMRFDEDCPIAEIIKTVPHIAFEVDDLGAALEGKEILSGVTSPCEGVRVAMILVDSAPVELMEFSRDQRGERNKTG